MSTKATSLWLFILQTGFQPQLYLYVNQVFPDLHSLPYQTGIWQLVILVTGCLMMGTQNLHLVLTLLRGDSQGSEEGKRPRLAWSMSASE
ncbi:hypothetical protein L1987_58187 [Smallanthus sonchifolius]|uniref:Uncharacterized protein n=1 Tax=Smallanthus sonchifolius TaxID=185202 RepID=A0ACB9DF30_9ASTR|nr:hypothetical protein L1987_58187 [Smallanthus sonchifolius]